MRLWCCSPAVAMVAWTASWAWRSTARRPCCAVRRWMHGRGQRPRCGPWRLTPGSRPPTGNAAPVCHDDGRRVSGRHGYRAADRRRVPPGIAVTRQLSGLCPSSSAFMATTPGDALHARSGSAAQPRPCRPVAGRGPVRGRDRLHLRLADCGAVSTLRTAAGRHAHASVHGRHLPRRGPILVRRWRAGPCARWPASLSRRPAANSRVRRQCLPRIVGPSRAGAGR